MVRAYFPQLFVAIVETNSNFPPQGKLIPVTPVDGGWVDNLDNQFIANTGTPIMFGDSV